MVLPYSGDAQDHTDRSETEMEKKLIQTDLDTRVFARWRVRGFCTILKFVNASGDFQKNRYSV